MTNSRRAQQDPSDPAGSHAVQLGREIRARRRKRGLTQDAFAARIGFSPQHVSEVERANTTASRAFVAACDDALEAHGALIELQRAAVSERALRRHDRGTAPVYEVRPAVDETSISGDNMGTSGGRVSPPSVLIRQAREAKGWSIMAAARALIDSSRQPLPDVDSVVRAWKRWEHDTTPSDRYRPLLAALLGIEPAALCGRNPPTSTASAIERPGDRAAPPQLLATMTLALTFPPGDDPAQVAGRHVGMTDVAMIVADIAHLRRLDHRYGSDRVRARVVSLLQREANTVRCGTYSEQTGKALLGAIAQLCWLAGLMAADVGRDALAQRYYLQALNLATGADDRLYAASVLAHTSRLSAQIGYRAVTDRDRARYGREAVAQARAGHSVAGGDATPVLAALLYAVEARGHALVGDARATRTAILDAQHHYEHAQRSQEPSWLAFYTEAELAADLGRCLRDVGQHERAVRLMTRALDAYEPWRTRSRCFVQTDLAAAHLAGRDFEQAAALGAEAVRAAGLVRSARAFDRLRVLQRQLRPQRTGSPHLVDLDDRISDVLARNRTPPPGPRP